jgi:uncharacterized protein (DUF924 family)
MSKSFDPRAVVAFWRAAGPSRWFKADPSFDAEVRRRLGALHEQAAAGDLAVPDTPTGLLALLILLDQVPRNIFRGTPRAFATDPQAREVSRHALRRGFDRRVPAVLRGFFYLPLMHSEDLADQERCLALYRALGQPEALRFAEIHADVIRRFGRFPHRNAALGRPSSAEEQAFLDAGGFRA